MLRIHTQTFTNKDSIIHECSNIVYQDIYLDNIGMVSFYMRFIWMRLRNMGTARLCRALPLFRTNANKSHIKTPYLYCLYTAILYFFLTVFYIKKNKIRIPRHGPHLKNALYRKLSSIKQKFIRPPLSML